MMAAKRNVVAIVDDDPVLRQALQGLLDAFGYRTETYASAEEFIALAPETKARCVVSDIQMGGMSGIEMAQHLAQTGFRFPTIFVTGSHDESLRRDASRLGCVAFLHKPCQSGQLIAAIATAIAIAEQRGVRAADGHRKDGRGEYA